MGFRGSVGVGLSSQGFWWFRNQPVGFRVQVLGSCGRRLLQGLGVCDSGVLGLGFRSSGVGCGGLGVHRGLYRAPATW